MGGHKRAYFGERVAEFVCRPPRTRVVVKLWSSFGAQKPETWALS